mmetsp:Transcript_57336/g.121664  ORF Transcript_57336/g.121664 Transcript_57336/m.121664 type:complete len:106 (+) Transcript_57336:552-869(+)
MRRPRSHATRSIKAKLAFMASQNVRRTVMLAQDRLLTSLLAGSPCQSNPVRVMICPKAMQGKNIVFKNSGWSIPSLKQSLAPSRHAPNGTGISIVSNSLIVLTNL